MFPEAIPAVMTVSPIHSSIVLSSAMGPTAPRPLTALLPAQTSALATRPSGYQVTVLDAAAGLRPREIVAKVESDLLPPGPAPDRPGVPLQFYLERDGVLHPLGSAVSDRFAFARLPFPSDLELGEGLHTIHVQVEDTQTWARGQMLITNEKPTLAVAVDGAVLRSRSGVAAFIARNLLHKEYEIVPGAAEALRELAEHYRIVYVAPLRDESLLETTRHNLFEKGGLPPGPILTNDFGWRFKEHSRTVSHQRLREFWDDTLAGLRGFAGVPVIAGVGRTDSEQIDRVVMDRHGLETRIVPETRSSWWKFWHWARPSRSRRLLAGKTVWQDIRDQFIRDRQVLGERARELFVKRFHPDAHVRTQTELDLVSNAVCSMGNSAKLYVDGTEAFSAVTSFFDGAESIFAEIYEFGPDTVGNTFAKIFGDKAAQKKPVRLTSDFFGSAGWSPRSILFFAKMAARGVHISRFVFPLAELPALIDAPFFRTHRKVVAMKMKGEDGRIRDVAVLGGRNWKFPYWFELHDYTVVVEGPVVAQVVSHLAKVANELTGSPLTKHERKAFAAESPETHPDGLPLRYVVHYPKDDKNIQRAFLSMLRNPDSNTFMMESPFPLMTEVMREVIAEKQAHPEKDIVWVTGTHGSRLYGPLDAYAHAQGLLLKRHGIRVLMRGPLNENKMSPMHAKKFSDGRNVAICSWNPDEQANKDLETCLMISPDPDHPKTSEIIDDMLDRGIRKDIVNGIDLEEWLQVVLEKQTGTLEDIYRALLLKVARSTQESLNYFL